MNNPTPGEADPRPVRDRFRAFLGSRRLPLWLALISVLLVLPSAGSGIHLDDYVHWFYLTGHTGVDGRALPATDIFNFVTGDSVQRRLLMDAGLLPWWTAPDLHLAFWRPVTGLTHWIDYTLWPGQPWIMHAQSYLWLALLVVVVTLLYRRLSAGLFAAGLAALLFAIDDARGLPAGWLANRNALVAAVFGMSALLAHVRWREDGWKPGAVIGPAALAAGLLSGEMAMGAAAFVLAYAFARDGAGPRSRVFSVLSYAAVLGAWLAYYSHAGYGAFGTGYYVDPVHEPARFLAALFEKVPVLLLDQFGFPPSSASVFLPPPLMNIMWWGGILFMGLLVILFLPVVREDRAARFFAAGLLLSLPLICTTVPHSRLLLFTGFGAMGLLGAWFDRHRLRAGRPAEAPRRRRPEKWAFVFFVVVHGVFAPLLAPVNALGAATGADYVQGPVSRMETGEGIREKTLVVVTAPVFFFTQLTPTVLLHQGRPYPPKMIVLAPGAGEVVVRRTGERTIVVDRKEGWLNAPFDLVYRDPGLAMAPGDVVELTDLRVEILGVTPDRRPAVVKFTFSKPPEDTSMVWKKWGNGDYLPFAPPAPGDSVIMYVRPAFF